MHVEDVLAFAEYSRVDVEYPETACHHPGGSYGGDNRLQAVYNQDSTRRMRLNRYCRCLHRFPPLYPTFIAAARRHPIFNDHSHDFTFLRHRSYHLRNYMNYGGVQRRVLCCFPAFPMSVPAGTQGLRLRKPQPALSSSTAPKARLQDEALLKDAVRKYVLARQCRSNYD